MRPVEAADEQIERERRQLRLMLDRLDRFSRDELPIGPVINDLEALLYQLELADEAWRGDFVEGWSDLEIPYAVALDRVEPIPTVRDPIVAEGVEVLYRLVRDRMSELGA
jgi:hypothetical protein